MVWKVVTVITNLRFTAYIAFHNVLHVFQAGHGTGTASLEAKLLQKLTAMREEVLYAIFLDLHKAYYALDREIYTDILKGYGMGTLSHITLCVYWDSFWMVY